MVTQCRWTEFGARALSFGDTDCNSFGAHMRVDPYTDFAEQHIDNMGGVI